ncbi:MAG: hypothetical protein DYG94_01775 [Leptolyngbya sp. PLA3]|nr:MAG: hypothetical protein EDM82_00110 [Cyanobacteria bacterium CYA]MCE7967461.1 hypothetical protein [Leptolyngbya sp. PL-A3]
MLRYVAMAALVMLGGCASVWERSYESRIGAAAESLPARADVAVREVPWSRVEEALRELSVMWEQSDEPYEEWAAEKKRQADAKLLRALQVTESVDEVQIIGRSSFKTVERVRPHAGALEKFARSIGADMAIWASRYVGKSERIESQPVYSSGYRHVQYYDTRAKRYRTRLEYDDWTTYVPVVIEADETAWVVYYLRHR